MSEVSGQHALVSRPSERPRRLPQHTVSNILIPLSMAIDLAEGRAPGHAQRVAYVSMAMAEAIGLDKDLQLSACYSSLVHDLGVIAASADIAGELNMDERLVFASLPLLTPEEALQTAGQRSDNHATRVAEHVLHGARAAQMMGLSEEVARAVATHHERWDGEGYPDGLVGPETPVTGRIVAIADHVEALISQTSPLLARRNFSYWMANVSGMDADPELVEALTALGTGDTFWLGLFNDDLGEELMRRCGSLREPKGANLLPMAESFARIVDARFPFTENISARVAHYAEMLGKAVGLPDLRIRQLRVAALLHDVGQLSMSERVLAKPGILSVDEMGSLQLHPLHSRDVVAAIPGLEEVADWVAAHHERIDGRGYPEGREGQEIPLESRILGVCDAYVAITSDRPHRPRADGREARERLRKAAGTQLDAELVDIFLGKVLA